MSTPEQHTPGPWRPHHKGATRVIANVPGHEGETHTICNTWSSPLSPPLHEARLNALLISAAPDLLAALEAALHYVACGCADKVETTKEGRANAGKVLEQLTAALAKAKGGAAS